MINKFLKLLYLFSSLLWCVCCSDNEKKYYTVNEINLIISNLTEVYTIPFKKDNINDTILTDYSAMRAAIDYGDSCKNNCRRIEIDPQLIRYISYLTFNKEPEKEISTNRTEYSDGKYYVSKHTDNTYTFAKCCKINSVKNDTFRIEANVYTGPIKWKPYISLSSSDWNQIDSLNVPVAYKKISVLLSYSQGKLTTLEMIEL